MKVVSILFDQNCWKLHDPDGSLSIKENRVRWVNLDRSTVRYVSKEIIVKDDFCHSFVVCVNEGYIEDQKNKGLIRLWEIRNDWDNRIWVFIRKESTGWTIHYEQRNKAKQIWSFNGSHIFPWGCRFIVELIRVNEDYRIRVLREKDNVILEDSDWVVGVHLIFYWIWLASSIKSLRNNGNWSTGYIENFIIS